MKKVFAIAAPLILLCQGTVASAQSYEAVKVSYADLNLQTPQGIAQLDGRIRYAARSVCGRDSAFDLKSRFDAARCEAKAINDARAEVSIKTTIHLASR
jgi:UrcA family protein